MIHAFAIEPELVATWARREEYRFIIDKFGLGTPRVMLELPAFTQWKRSVHEAATNLGVSEQDMLRLAELFRVLGEARSVRPDAVYDAVRSWLENAEAEHRRRPMAAILATSNPRNNPAVIAGADLGNPHPRWSVATGSVAARAPADLAKALSAMIINASELHLIDPHFGPDARRYREVLEALLGEVAAAGRMPRLVRVHCSDKATLSHFERTAAQELPRRIPAGMKVEFARWCEHAGGDAVHNRYVLTELGGVTLGKGLDAGAAGHRDDLNLMAPDQYRLRWAQYVGRDGSYTLADSPAAVMGTKQQRRR